MNDAKRVLVFCAHSDDQVFGAGGTTARLARQGADVRTIICSFGEQSHPHLQEIEVRKLRVQESKRANQVLGGSRVSFLGLREGKFWEEYEEKDWRSKLVRLLQRFKPEVIITHSSDDPHPDHRAVHRIILDLYERSDLHCELYAFDVWTLFNLRKRRTPRLIVDITQTFTRKLDALAVFKSQRAALVTLLWSVYAKAIWWGLKRDCRYAEVFYKVRG
jgi:LmbE family N-acetylglucosaminyl deacetylase